MNDIVTTAEQAMKDKNWSEAIKLWQKISITLKDQTPPQVFALLAMSYRLNGKLEKADQIVCQAMQNFPENINILKEYIEIAKLMNNWLKVKDGIFKLRTQIKKSAANHFLSIPTSKLSTDHVKNIYWHFNNDHPDSDRNYHPEIMLKAAKFGYFNWPLKYCEYITGKSVLDVGCGCGLHSLGYIVAGARQYVGIDPTIKMDDDSVKNKNGSRKKGGILPRVQFGWTPRQINQLVPRAEFVQGTFEDSLINDKFDLITMITVTEHLMNIEEVFEGCKKRLKKTGLFIFYHHNYYCWNGHHQAPKRVMDIDWNDEKQKRFIDWNHLKLDSETKTFLSTRLNMIRLDELKKITQKYFTIIKWNEKFNDFSRLTPKILKKWFEYSKRELSVHGVLCIARH